MPNHGRSRDTNEGGTRAAGVRDHQLADDGAGDELVEVTEHRALRQLHRRPV